MDRGPEVILCRTVFESSVGRGANSSPNFYALRDYTVQTDYEPRPGSSSLKETLLRWDGSVRSGNSNCGR